MQISSINGYNRSSLDGYYTAIQTDSLLSTKQDSDTPLDQISAPVDDLDMNNNKITNLSNPENAKDAVNKQYADSLISDINDNFYTKLETNVLLELKYDTSTTLDEIAQPEQPLDLNNKRIQNLANPILDQDAVTKKYFFDNQAQAGDTIINNITEEITNNYYDKTAIDAQQTETQNQIDQKIDQDTIANGLPSDLNMGGNAINNLPNIPVDGAFQVPVAAMPLAAAVPIAALGFPLIFGLPIAALVGPAVNGLWPAINDNLLDQPVNFGFLNDLLQYIFPISASINQLQGIPESPLLLGNQPIQNVGMDPNDVSGTQAANQGYVDEQVSNVQQANTETQAEVDALETAFQNHTHTKILNDLTEVAIVDNQVKMKINNIVDQLIIRNQTNASNVQIVSPLAQQFLSGSGSFSFTNNGTNLSNNGVYVQLPDLATANRNAQLCVQLTNSNPLLCQNLTISSGHIDIGQGQQPYSAISNQTGGLQFNLQLSAGTPVLDATLTLLSRNYATLLSMMPFTFNDRAGYTSTTTITNENQFTSKTYVDTSISTVSTNLSTNYQTTTVSDGKYQLISGMTGYLASSVAASTYQTIAGMSSYLTSSSAASTYQTIGDMINYYTKSTIDGTFQTLSGMSQYVTNSSLTSTLLNYLPMNTRLDQLQVPTSSVNLNGQRITGGGLAVNPDDFVVLSQLVSGTQNVWAGRITLGPQTTLTSLQTLSSPTGIILSGTKIASSSYGVLMNRIELDFNIAILPVVAYTIQITLLNNYNETNQDYNSELAQEGIIVQSVSRSGATLMWKTTNKLQTLNAGLRLMIALIAL